MKKMLKSLVLIMIVISVFLIYILFKNDKINYIALGDSLAEGINPYGELGYGYTDYYANYLDENNKLSYYTKEYTKSSYTTLDIIKELQNNNKMKKDLRESNLVTISIGAKDLLNKVKTDDLNINQILALKKEITPIFIDLESCIKEIRKYAKEDMVVIGYYNPIPFLFNTSGNDIDELFAYIDDEYKKITEKYDCIYISIYQLFKQNSSFLSNPSNNHPNSEGYKAIADEIIKNYKL